MAARNKPFIVETDSFRLIWAKSSASGAGQTNCVELARDIGQVVLVRCSRHRSMRRLAFPAGGWSQFLAGVQRAEFDRAR